MARPLRLDLLAQTRRANLSRWMHWLMVSYTVYCNWRHRRGGHLFQGRFKSLLVEDGEYLLGLSRYLHFNPVRGAVFGSRHSDATAQSSAGLSLEQLPGICGFGEAVWFRGGRDGAGRTADVQGEGTIGLPAFCGGRFGARDRESLRSRAMAGYLGE